jgi:hypothetical protein
MLFLNVYCGGLLMFWGSRHFIIKAMLFLNVYYGGLLMFGDSRHFIVRDLLLCTTAMVGLRSVACADLFT